MVIPDNSVESYAWWREHGHEWPKEVEERKKTQIIYTLQECFIQTYLGALAPAKILEFGCGFGRHLRYLSNLPGLDCFGCDQSKTMLDGVQRWAGPEWTAARIAQIEALLPLPYPDKAFDVIFTTSVLIHIAPAHLLEILRELVRVARYQIIHIENNQVDHTRVSSTEHDGCWMHPLIDVYREMGASAEVLEKGFIKQDIYRVKIKQFDRPTEIAERLLGQLAILDNCFEALTLRANP